MTFDNVMDTYVLPRDEGERLRLSVQYSYLKRVLCDGRVVYDKTVAIPPLGKILDSGSGSGVWALDVVEQLPASVEVYAADLSSDNFPASHPSNVHFSEASTTALPPEWSDRFDFINQRVLIAGLQRKQWPEALAELYRVLKPGGAIQLVELDLFRPVPESPGVSYYRDKLEAGFNSMGFCPEIATRLGELCTEAGFIDVVAERKPTPVGRMWGEIGKQGAMMYKGAMEKVPQIFLQAGFVQSKEEYEELVNKLEKEWDEQGTQYHGVIVCARKPLE